MNDNGGKVGVPVFNAGMRGRKVTPWLGGTRASSFWRWPGTLKPTDCDRLSAHIDFFPTLAEIADNCFRGETAAGVQFGSGANATFENNAFASDVRAFFATGSAARKTGE